MSVFITAVLVPMASIISLKTYVGCHKIECTTISVKLNKTALAVSCSRLDYIAWYVNTSLYSVYTIGEKKHGPFKSKLLSHILLLLPHLLLLTCLLLHNLLPFYIFSSFLFLVLLISLHLLTPFCLFFSIFFLFLFHLLLLPLSFNLLLPFYINSLSIC
jgi:hypothetical protein